MSKIAEDIKKEMVQNEGDITVEELFLQLEKHRGIQIGGDEAYEKAREHYNTVKDKFEESQAALKELESSIEAFENKVVFLTGGKVTKEELTKFRENSNAISVWFGKNAAFLQYTAASGVVFADAIQKAAGEKH